jgi:phosphoenolpyruvate synthase/pyruvate phosphate dikinase
MGNNKNENGPIIKWFNEINNSDVPLVGGKNA